MICYLIRHGKDDDSVRGGWSDVPLTNEGIAQVKEMSLRLAVKSAGEIGRIYSSDLRRARQTADIISEFLHVPVVELAAFREVNNGILAGMKNDVAAKRYPGLYWGTLEWDAHYPNGESPHDFYKRISTAWSDFKSHIRNMGCDVVLVTNGGVLNVIQCIENDTAYSNRYNQYPVPNGGMVILKI